MSESCLIWPKMSGLLIRLRFVKSIGFCIFCDMTHETGGTIGTSSDNQVRHVQLLS